jgi:hypothetical protein
MKKYLPYLIIFFTCLLAFWQVAFLTQSLKYDILDGYLPGHFFLSECLRNSVFPLWNPYQQLGYPIYADLLNTNYVVDMVIGRLFPYTNITFHFLFIIYVIIAGTGIYKLTKELGIDFKLSILIAIAYALSGFITGNAQHIQFIIGAAWLPFTLLYFIRLARGSSLINILLFVVFTILFITGGYPSFAILLAYLLIGIYVYVVSGFLKKRKYKSAVTFSFRCLIAAILLLALCSGIIISIYQATPYVSRFAGLSYEYATTNPFTPKSLISILSPLLTASQPALFDTDVSMNNHYFGIILFVFFLYGLSKPQNIKSMVVLVAMLIMLLLSFGDHAFLHRIFYEYVPFFNKFRHPSAFRLFTILFLLLFTGIQANRFLPANPENIKRFTRIYAGTIGMIIFIFVVSVVLFLRIILGPASLPESLTALASNYGPSGALMLQSFIILLLHAGFVYFVLVRKKTEWFYKMVMITMLAEAVVFTQLNLRYTVVADLNPKESGHFLRNQPAGFPLPDHHLIGENTEESVSHFPIINNTNNYSKTVSPYYKLYPFSLDGFNALEEDSALFKNTTHHPLMYFADTLLPANYEQTASVIRDPKRNYVFIEDSILKGDLNNLTLSEENQGSPECTYFSPSKIEFESNTTYDQFAVLQQNNYPGWMAFIDGKKVKLYTVNRTLMGIVVPAGKHILRFEFTNVLYVKATIASFILISFLLLIILVLKTLENKRTKHWMLYAGCIGILLVMTAMVIKPRKKFEAIERANTIQIKEYVKEKMAGHRNDSIFLFFNVESSKPYKELIEGRQFSFQRFRDKRDGIALMNMLDTLKQQDLVYIWSNVLEIPELREIIRMYYPIEKERHTGCRMAVITYSKNPVQNGTIGNEYLNTYETTFPKWTNNGLLLDSTCVFAGKCSEKLTADRVYSSSFSHMIDQVPANGIKVFTAIKFRTMTNEPVYLVIAVNRKGKNKYYYAGDIRMYARGPENWNTGIATQQWLKSSLRTGDKILVYCWNSGKNEALYLDDFSVRIIEL